MTSPLGVRPQDLVTHADHLEAIGGRVATAASAGVAVRPGSEAYGKLCVLVPLMLGALQEVLVEGIREAAESLDDTGARLRATAESYRATDEHHGQVLRGIQDR